ncbi:MAG: SRPBCC family protein [Candidatus Omnitrophica bacterium]|nr:SRPBCC family protein [Candidatus Omnitrophota bacterium]
MAPHRAHIVAEITLPAPQERVWSVLTDYDSLSEFVPPLEKSRVIRRERDYLLLYQKGGIRLPFYHHFSEVIFEVREDPPHTIYFEAVAGDFLIDQGSWRLEPAEKGTRITHETTIEPTFFIPRWLMGPIERALLKSSFRGIVKRCLAAPA